jgi:hypothetical protein
LTGSIPENGRSPGPTAGSGAPQGGEELRRLECRLLAGLVLSAAVLRAASAIRVAVIATDGVQYLEQADLLARGQVQAALSMPYHPLFPALAALLSPLAGSAEAAALAVSVLLSTLTLPILYCTAKGLFGRRTALVVGAVFAFLPPMVRCGADALSEGTFLFFLALLIELARRGFGRNGALLPLLAGISCALAYLTRPEGVVGLLAVGLFTAVQLAAGVAGRPRWRTAVCGLLVLGGFLAAAFPYLLYLRVDTGAWELSRKKAVENFSAPLEKRLEEASARKPPDVEFLDPGRASLRTLESLLADLYVVPAAFVLLGMAVPRRRKPEGDWRRELLTLLVSGVWLCVCLVFQVTHGYLSHRHALPVALFLLPYAGRGAVLAADFLGRWVHRLPVPGRSLPGAPGSAPILAFLVAFAFVAGIPENLRAYRKDKRHERTIGRELAARGDGSATAMGTLPRVSYYAGFRHVPVPFEMDIQGARRLARESGASFLVLEEGHLETWAPALREALRDPGRLPSGFQPAGRWEVQDAGGPRTLLAFRIRLP